MCELIFFQETSVRYTHIVVDAVHTTYDPSFGNQKDHSYPSTSSIHALFVTVRDYGLIKKISYNTATQVSIKRDYVIVGSF